MSTPRFSNSIVTDFSKTWDTPTMVTTAQTATPIPTAVSNDRTLRCSRFFRTSVRNHIEGARDCEGDRRQLEPLASL